MEMLEGKLQHENCGSLSAQEPSPLPIVSVPPLSWTIATTTSLWEVKTAGSFYMDPSMSRGSEGTTSRRYYRRVHLG